jgi:hypothetical protein
VEPRTLHDPELDPPRRRNPEHVRRPHLPEEYQRLVANPFLAVFVLLVGLAIVLGVLEFLGPVAIGLALLGVVPVGLLLQYHCLDCGRTGHLFRWKSHACDRVQMRQASDQVRRFRGPNPTYQAMIWAYLLTAVGILVGVVLLAVHI